MFSREWQHDFSTEIKDQLDRDIYNNHHLVFRTEYASFHIGEDIKHYELIRRSDDPLQKISIETSENEREILNDHGDLIGQVCLNDYRSEPGQPCEFILLSEAQFIGSEKRVDILGYCLYNVMAVKQEEGSNTRIRIGLSKLYKRYWKEAEPKTGVIVLG